MTPLPENPVVVVLVEEVNGAPNLAVATNIAPELMVKICHERVDFEQHKQGLPFINDGKQ